MLGLHEIRQSTAFDWEKVLSDREKVDAFFSPSSLSPLFISHSRNEVSYHVPTKVLAISRK